MRLAFALLAACSSTPSSSPPPPHAEATPVEPAPHAPAQASAPARASAAPAQASQAAGPPTRVVRVRDYAAVCRGIAGDIERIRSQFPQLVDFRASAATHADCAIDYGFHTHRSTSTGGWSAGVPNPDDDGIWFYIGIYDPNGPEAGSQLHTQPVVPNWWIGERKVMFLVLEGKRTTPAGDHLLAILSRHGLVTK